jgi:predicted MFS family arabinose efflux permease
MASYLRIIRGFSPSVRYYILASASGGFAYFGIFTVLYNLFLLRLGYSIGLIGQVNGVGQLCWALLALPASWLGRRIGLRNAQVTSSLIIATGYVLFLLVEMLPEPGRIAWLFATTILVWAGAALLTVNGLPYLVGITQPGERSHALAVTNSVSALAAVAGSLVAGFLPAQIASLIGAAPENPAPYRLTLWLAPIFFALAAFFFSRMRPSELMESKSENLSTSKAPLLIFLFFGVIIFFQTASEGAVRAFFNIYLDQNLGMPIAQIGTLFALAGLLPIFGSLLMPLLVARVGSGGAFVLTGLGSAVFLMLLGLIPHPLAAAFGFAAFNLIASLIGAVRGILSQEIVQPLWRTATSAILIMGLAFGWASMALLGSVLIETVKFSGLMLLSTGCALVSISLLYAYLRRNPTSPVATALTPSSEGA